MRRLLPAVLLAILALVIGSPGADKSATRIIDRYKKASGGDAVKRVKNTLMLGSLKANDGSTGRFSYQSSTPSSLKLDLEVGGTKTSECYNGKSAWRTDCTRLAHLARGRSETVAAGIAYSQQQTARASKDPHRASDGG